MRYRSANRRTFTGRLLDSLILLSLLFIGYHFYSRHYAGVEKEEIYQQNKAKKELSLKHADLVLLNLKKASMVHQEILVDLDSLCSKPQWSWKKAEEYFRDIFQDKLTFVPYPTVQHFSDSIFSPKQKAILDKHLPEIQNQCFNLLDQRNFWLLQETRENLFVLRNKFERWVALEQEILSAKQVNQ
ncbi:MAG: hypothetical protein ACPF8V_08300 [Luteibaculum sp.]